MSRVCMDRDLKGDTEYHEGVVIDLGAQAQITVMDG